MRKLNYLDASFAATNPPQENMVRDILSNTCNPIKELIFEDEVGMFIWPPGHNTLVEFMNSYNSLFQRLDDRIKAILGETE